jgi:hypothetical protein
MNRKAQMETIQKEGLDLFVRKNKDYGDAFATYGTIGVLVRIGDKINRLNHVSKNKINLVNDETLRDTLIDLHNYAAMAIMLLDEKSEVAPDHVETGEPKSMTKSTSSSSFGHEMSSFDNLLEYGQYTHIF